MPDMGYQRMAEAYGWQENNNDSGYNNPGTHSFSDATNWQELCEDMGISEED